MTARASTAIIPFPLDRARRTAPPMREALAAEVLIFTGVQVERLDHEAVAQPPRKPRRAARKARDRF